MIPGCQYDLLSLASLDQMSTDPLRELVAPYRPRGQSENGALLLVRRRTQFMAVEHQKGFHRRVSGPLVAVHERMVHHEGKGQRGSLLDYARIQILAAEGHIRLGDGRFQGAEVAHPCCPAGLF